MPPLRVKARLQYRRRQQVVNFGPLMIQTARHLGRETERRRFEVAFRNAHPPAETIELFWAFWDAIIRGWQSKIRAIDDELNEAFQKIEPIVDIELVDNKKIRKDQKEELASQLDIVFNLQLGRYVAKANKLLNDIRESATYLSEAFPSREFADEIARKRAEEKYSVEPNALYNLKQRFIELRPVIAHGEKICKSEQREEHLRWMSSVAG